MNRDDANRESARNAGESNANADDIAELWLDDGLARYAMAEPRDGLEGRVLARLAEARRESRQGSWWGVLAFGAVAALMVAAVWLGWVDRKTISHTPIAKVEAPRHTSRAVVPDSPRLEPTKPARTSGSTRSHQRESAPKLEQFPSTAPLNKQEEMLARYVRDFPQRATLMAQAQTDIRKEEEREMAAPRPGGAGADFDQRE